MAVVLIGFMGAGKSTLGKRLADECHLPFVDLDTYIEQQEQMKISDIFAEKGERYFRALEHQALNQFVKQNVVIATGGGIVENTNNIDIINKNKLNIWVDTNIDTIYNRIVGDKSRPNAVDRSFDDIKELYNSRCSRYNEIAYIKVDSENSVEDCIDYVMNILIAEE